MRRGATRHGLTLPEFLVIVALVAVAGLLLFPAVQYLRRAHDRTGCENNLRRLALALGTYVEKTGHFPAGYRCAVASAATDTGPGWGWASALLPYLGQQGLADSIDPAVGLDDPRYQALRTTPLRVFQCPADLNRGVFTVLDAAENPLVQAATNSYAANYGAGGDIAQHPDQGNGVFFADSRITPKDITRGTSNTLALGERGAILAQTPWAGAVPRGTVRTMPDAPVLPRLVGGAPVQVLAGVSGGIPLNDPASMPACFFSPHTGVVHFALADGAVRPFSTRTDYKVIEALARRADAGGDHEGKR